MITAASLILIVSAEFLTILVANKWSKALCPAPAKILKTFTNQPIRVSVMKQSIAESNGGRFAVAELLVS